VCVLLSRSIIIDFKKVFFIKLFSLIFLVFYYTLLNLNSFIFTCSFLPDNLNMLLLNSINKIHPLILYLCLFFFITSFFNIFNLIVNSKQKDSCLNFFSLYTLKNKVFYSIITLFLGSWWAIQEGSWGGWWNWDFSEVFGLLIFAKLVVLLHSRFCFKSFNLNLIFYLSTISVLFLFYISIQINFSYVSHNFGFIFYKFLSTSIFLNTLFFCFSYVCIYFYVFYKRIVIELCTFKLLHNLRLSKLALIMLFFINSFSLWILVNDFFWNNFNINILNIQINFNTLLKYYILFFFFYNLSVTFYVIFVLLIIFKHNEFWLMLWFFYLKKFSLINLAHLILMISIFFSLIYFTDILTYHKFIELTKSEHLLYKLKFNLSIIEEGSNVIELGSSPDLKYFSLLFKNFTLVQDFYLLGYKDLIYLQVLDLSPTLIYFLFLFIIILFYFKASIIIMF